MKIMVIGGGGREHAIIKKLKQSPLVEKIFALPGNGGIASDAECVDIKAKDIEGIINFVKQNPIDFAVVAPDDPLALGAVDELNKLGIPCFGPDKKAAVIESSKAFAKNLMRKYGIPTAEYAVFEDKDKAFAYLETHALPVVIKADGLALGKGVIIASSLQEAKDAVEDMLSGKLFGKSGARVVIEEFLQGVEVSVLSFTDGKTLVPMVSSMDHKRALDGDLGLNTGGMGAVAPNPYYTSEIAERCYKEIFMPTVRAMNAEGRPFKGCLYFGLMLTDKGPYVIEYNCRFGDPETQAVLPLLETDLMEIMLQVADGTLNPAAVRFKKAASCCVVVASKGYPVSYENGYPIRVKQGFDAELYVAGARLTDKGLVSAGGRVLGVTALADTLPSAIERAYENAAKIEFENGYFRKDIGKKALAAAK